MNTEFYDFQAKADHPTNRSELPLLFQALVTERFRLQFHRETRTLPCLELTVDKGGHKLTLNDGPDKWEIMITGDGGGPPPAPPRFKGVRASMPYLCWWIAQRENRPVVDKTGLPGFYDFKLEFAPDLGGRPLVVNGEQFPGFDGPTIFTALRQQLGLRLESTKGPVDVMVIDHVEHATDN